MWPSNWSIHASFYIKLFPFAWSLILCVAWEKSWLMRTHLKWRKYNIMDTFIHSCSLVHTNCKTRPLAFPLNAGSQATFAKFWCMLELIGGCLAFNQLSQTCKLWNDQMKRPPETHINIEATYLSFVQSFDRLNCKLQWTAMVTGLFSDGFGRLYPKELV